MHLTVALLCCCAGTAALMSPSVVVGLNSALQRTVAVERLAVGSVNRAVRSSTGVGGKGQGCYVALTALWRAHGGDRPCLAQFEGTGGTAAQLRDALGAATGGADDDSLWVRTKSATRVATTLVEAGGAATEIVEPSGHVEPGEFAALLAALRARPKAAGMAIMGSAPPGVPADCYAQIVSAATGTDSLAVVDTVVGLDALLGAAAATGCTVLLKLNARELIGMAKLALPQGGDSEAAADFDTAAAAAHAVAASLPPGAVRFVAWTDGPFPAGLVDVAGARDEATRFSLPPLPGPVLSPIGAGDSVSAGTLHKWTGAGAGAPAAAFRFGLAVGAASCLSASNACFDVATVEEIASGIGVETVVVGVV